MLFNETRRSEFLAAPGAADRVAAWPAP